MQRSTPEPWPEVEDIEGFTVPNTQPEKPRRKSPERFGPVMAVDLCRVQVLVEYYGSNGGESVLENAVREIDRLILRAKIAEAQARKDRKLAKAAK